MTMQTLFTLPSWPVVFKDTCLTSWFTIGSLQNSSLKKGKQTWRKNGEKKQVAMLHTFKIILFEVQLPLGTVHLICNLLGGKPKTTTGRA